MRLRGFGTGATALALLFTWGCSGSPEPPAEGGLYFHIESSPTTPTGKKCTIPSHYASLGSTPPSLTTKGKPVIDGENGGHVSCTADGSGTVKFHGTITKGAVSFAVSAGVVEKGGTGTALLQEADDASTVQLETPEDTPCTVDVSKEKLSAGDGHVWAELSCPALINRNQPSVYCAGDGAMILQNCD